MARMGTLKMCLIGIGVVFLLAVSVWQQFTLSQQHTEMINLRANLRANNEQSVAGSFDSPADAGTTVSCPGGSQLACMDLCLASVFQSCVQSCANRCSTEPPPPTAAAASAEVDQGAVQATTVQVAIVDPDESAGSAPDEATEEEAAEVKEKQEATQGAKAVAVKAAQGEQEAAKKTTAGPTTAGPTVTTAGPTTAGPTTPAPTTAGAKEKQEAGDIVGTVSGSKREWAKTNLTGSASTLILPPPSEWLDDIDTKSSILGCGVSKCAFHSRTSLLKSRTNPDHRGRYGYLVTERRKVEDAFELAQELAKTFSIRHALLADPIKIMDLDVQPTELYPN